MTRTEFLKNKTLSAENKCMRTPMPSLSVKDAPCSLPERKALALRMIFDRMPVYIGENELIVGTRTYFQANKGNETGEDVFGYGLNTRVDYVTDEEIEFFGCDQSHMNRTHYTPDLSIVLKKGVRGIIESAKKRMENPLRWLSST